ncbi:two-component system, CitB family, response regulator DctR [Salinibacillus kushneri]|uniref:Two-component system, CitB family, response regulator DctR n=2 Tax=Salinibacillus kushneri TaxID=237682 RepID=A0A1H9YGL4_9BACI|nr:two-component system, CitB family, response regulator DctR [Salinibacillus kushneri]
MKEQVKVFIIEDDPMVLEVNKQFVEKVDGFQVIGDARDGREAVDKVVKTHPDLILLDIFMPVKDGVEVIQQLRAQQVQADIIVITAANDKETLRTMLHNGVVDYIIKPFKFERLQKALQNYRTYVRKLSSKQALNQQQIDSFSPLLLSTDRKHCKNQAHLLSIDELPKGLNEQTLKQIISFLQKQSTSISAEEAADGIGIARVTARRYLDFLQRTGKVEIDLRYGEVGRPVNRYFLVGDER